MQVQDGQVGQSRVDVAVYQPQQASLLLLDDAAPLADERVPVQAQVGFVGDFIVCDGALLVRVDDAVNDFAVRVPVLVVSVVTVVATVATDGARDRVRLRQTAINKDQRCNEHVHFTIKKFANRIKC